ncbi:hypothetical protein DSL64_04965 [Dyadobacter luteus]|uniref:Uncharacterized protein n=1 Tax=Dyadobacter luteus TaxID=2259619 RepID=A0A3D8YJ01_9BACT|nr:hypothetical protein DSL64_04965 [Dyadobacter luteus]
MLGIQVFLHNFTNDWLLIGKIGRFRRYSQLLIRSVATTPDFFLTWILLLYFIGKTELAG